MITPPRLPWPARIAAAAALFIGGFVIACAGWLSDARDAAERHRQR
jgi:hypothetical protein